MARKTSSAIRLVSAPARMPSIKINVPRQRGPITRKAKRHIRRGYSAAKNALMSSERVGAIVGAAVLGLLDKAGTQVPTIPILGRAGTLGIAAYYLGKHMKSPTVQHAATGFLSIAVYELTREGKIAGVDGAAAVV